MKRPLLATLIIGIFVVVGVRALHLSQQLVQFEDRAVNYVSSWDAATRIVSKPAQYAILSILAFGVAALTLSSLRRGRSEERRVGKECRGGGGMGRVRVRR